MKTIASAQGQYDTGGATFISTTKNKQLPLINNQSINQSINQQQKKKTANKSIKIYSLKDFVHRVVQGQNKDNRSVGLAHWVNRFF
jgi:hypothetical protein